MNLIKKIQSILNFHNFENKINSFVTNYNESLYSYKSPKVNLGQIQSRLNASLVDIDSLSDVEFQVFSQFGDDGIIQYLVEKINIPNKTFVEFGVENYIEANTRFLVFNNKWQGLVIDGDQKNIKYIKDDVISRYYHLFSSCNFITKDNINNIIKDEFLDKGYDKEIGILSVDIDGVDYWIWDSIDCINPIIVIVEYNSVFGAENKWTVPYRPDFQRIIAHKSYQYWGASLNAFIDLGSRKGYDFIGCNSNGNNAYFVRKDKNNLKTKTNIEGFVEAQFREHEDENGKKWGGTERLNLIKGMSIYNLDTNKIENI